MTTSTTPTAGQKTKALCIATRCTSVDQFIATFHRFCDESSFFVATMTTRPVGLETAFSIQLEGGTPVMRGYCVVLEAWSTPANRFGRPGVRLGVRRLTSESMPVFKQLQSARAAAVGSSELETPPKLPRTVTSNTLKRADGTPSSRLPKIPTTPAAAGSGPASLRERLTKLATPASGIAQPASRTTLPLSTVAAKPAEPSTSSSEVDQSAVPEPIPSPLDPPGPPPPPAPGPPPAPRTASRDTAPTLQPPIVDPPAPPPSGPPVRESYDVVRADATPIPTAPTDDRTTPVSNESRVPGSSFVLPANPLHDISDESLEGFIEVSLYEETANFKRPSGEIDTLIDLEDDPLAPPPPPLAPRPITGPVPTVPDPPRDPTRDRDPGRSGGHEVFSHVVLPSISSPSIPRAGGVQRFPVPPVEDTGSLLALSDPGTKRKWMVIVGAVGLVGLVIVILVLASGSDEPARHAEPTQVAAPQIVPPPVPEIAIEPPAVDAGVPAVTPPVAADQPAMALPEPAIETDGPPVVGSGPCRMQVATTPAGSIIKLDGEPLGPSPLTIAGPCTKRKIDVEHPRYQTATRFVVPTPTGKKPAAVDVTLIRPTHSLTINTVPQGATIMISGRRAGTSPTVVKLMGFTPLTLTFKKAGYKPASEKVYSKSSQGNLTVRLQKQ